MRSGKARKRGAVGTRGVVSDLMVFACVGLLASVHVWTRVQGTLAGYELSSAQSEQRELMRENRSLKLELASRKAASRIEADARTRLGMVDPSPDRIFPVPSAPSRARHPAVASVERAR